MTRPSIPWDTLLLTAIMLIASVCAQSQAAVQNAKTDDFDAQSQAITPRGGIIEGGGIQGDVEGSDAEGGHVEEPVYWIGIRGRSIESAVLRTHLQLAEDMGVVVEEVLTGSPAATAGLRKHDIILRVNGDAVDNMQRLQSQIRASKEKSLELKIVRLGKQEKISLVPQVLPERHSQADRPPGRLRGRPLEGDAIQQLLEQFGARNLGPGTAFRGGQRFNFNQLPNGVSVSIQRNNNGPAQITVKQGDKTWQLEGDDEGALQQLPDELRPHVERMLTGQHGFLDGFGGAFDLRDLNAELEGILPRGLGNFRPQIRPQGGVHRGPLDRQEDPLRKRMEQLEKRLQQLQQRFDNGEQPPLPLDKTT